MSDRILDPLVFKALVKLFNETATELLFVVTVPDNEVIDEAKEELFVFIELPIVVIELANDEDAFVIVEFVVVIDAAIEELLFTIVLNNPSILNAAELLFVVTVPLKEVTEELRDADVVLKEELNVVKLVAADELNVVSVF